MSPAKKLVNEIERTQEVLIDMIVKNKVAKKAGLNRTKVSKVINCFVRELANEVIECGDVYLPSFGNIMIDKMEREGPPTNKSHSALYKYGPYCVLKKKSVMSIRFQDTFRRKLFDYLKKNKNKDYIFHGRQQTRFN